MQGKRYTEQEKAKILKEYGSTTLSVQDFAKRHKISTYTLWNWSKQAEKKTRVSVGIKRKSPKKTNGTIPSIPGIPVIPTYDIKTGEKIVGEGFETLFDLATKCAAKRVQAGETDLLAYYVLAAHEQRKGSV